MVISLARLKARLQNSALRLFLLLFITSFSSVYANESNAQADANLTESAQKPTESAIEPNCCDAFEETEATILELNSRIKELQKELKSATTEESESTISQRIEHLELQLTEARRAFERLSLGGIDPTHFALSTVSDDDSYDWQNELLQIVQPVFAEVQRMTKTTRERDKLTRNLTTLNEKIAELEKGLQYLGTVPTDKLSKTAQNRITELGKNWASYHRDLKRQQETYTTSLNALEDDYTFWEKLKIGAWEFLTGRGLILFTAFSTFFGILYLLTKSMDLLIARRERNGYTRKVNLKWRLLLLAYRLFAVILSLFAFLVVLHSMGDMVLFGLAILILMAILFGFRNYVPRYFSELRLFLNLGAARQGERVIYRGIPWKVEKINLYSAYLVNPLLDNGRIRLMLPELATLTSRPVEMDEIWFPSRVGESFMMSDGTFVEVLRQTPEAVYLESFNSHIIYPTADFIAAKPKNLSLGYYTVVDFGLAYQHFSIPVDVVFEKIHTAVETFLQGTDIHDQYNSLSVEFRKINEGVSLVYTIIISMKGSAAGYYYQAGRLVQEACLRCAQQEGWSMPFSHVSLKSPEENLFKPHDNVTIMPKPHPA